MNLDTYRLAEMPKAGEPMQITLQADSPMGRRGDVLTLSLTPADVHDSTELPTYLAGYRPANMRADEASPVILVDYDQGKFRSFSADDTFQRVDVKGSIEANIPEIDPRASLVDYKVVDRFIGSFINDITAQNAAGSRYQPRQAAMRRCQRAIQLDREIDVWTLLTTSGSWNAGNVVTLVAGEQWNGGASADPIGDLQNMMEDSAQQITDFWMNQQSANAMISSVSVRNHLRQMLGDASVADAINRVSQATTSIVDFIIPGLPPVHVVAGKVKNETSGALDYILGPHVVGTVSPGGVPSDGEEIASTYTFRRRGGAGVGYETREFRVENRGPKGGVMVVVSMADIAVMTGNTSGGLLRSVIQ
jgi:hypothetical protein